MNDFDGPFKKDPKTEASAEEWASDGGNFPRRVVANFDSFVIDAAGDNFREQKEFDPFTQGTDNVPPRTSSDFAFQIPPAVDWTDRNLVRRPCHLAARFRPLTGETLAGYCKNQNARGFMLTCPFIPDQAQPATDGEIGVLELFLGAESAAPSLELFVGVVWVNKNFNCIGFERKPFHQLAPEEQARFAAALSDKASPIRVQNDHGDLEDGWQIHPYHHPVPPAIQRELSVQNEEELIVLCRKTSHSGDSYKWFGLSDLVAMQTASASSNGP